ncbi:hypothetical protein M0813_01223 [Anaeramoeba flamelloides]|uniref:Uncharacterized protein n=1 Tax=Anaeramoeba flamelloides TaxID=1746091 RepID=A0ABQ8ZBY3_9EUKA|nr:hypothetical protein M0813_01223 [Anaeramoeba flamelloides]
MRILSFLFLLSTFIVFASVSLCEEISPFTNELFIQDIYNDEEFIRSGTLGSDDFVVVTSGWGKDDPLRETAIQMIANDALSGNRVRLATETSVKNRIEEEGYLPSCDRFMFIMEETTFNEDDQPHNKAVIVDSKTQSVLKDDIVIELAYTAEEKQYISTLVSLDGAQRFLVIIKTKDRVEETYLFEGQLISKEGDFIGDRFALTEESSDRLYYDSIALSNGDFLFCSIFEPEDENDYFECQRHDSDGGKLGEPLSFSDSSGDTSLSELWAIEDGSKFVIYTELEGQDCSFELNIYHSNDGSLLQSNCLDWNYARNPQLLEFTTDNLILLWSSSDIKGQLISKESGSLFGDILVLVKNEDGKTIDQFHSALLTSEKFVLAFEVYNNEGHNDHNYNFKVLNSDGTAYLNKTTWYNYDDDANGFRLLGGLENDEFLLLLCDNFKYNDSKVYQSNILIQQFDSEGTKVADEIEIAPNVDNNERSISDSFMILNSNNEVFLGMDIKYFSNKIFHQIWSNDGELIKSPAPITDAFDEIKTVNLLTNLQDNKYSISYILDDFTNEVVGQIFDSNGDAAKAEFTIYENEDDRSSLRFLNSIKLSDGDKIVYSFGTYWWDDDGSYYSLFFQIYNLDGTQAGELTQVFGNSSVYSCSDFEILPLDEGQFVLIYTERDSGRVAQVYDSNSNVIESEFTVIENEDIDDLESRTILLPNNRFLVCWFAEQQVNCQKFNADSTAYGSMIETALSHEPYDLNTTLLNNGDWAMSYELEDYYDDGTSAIEIKIMDPEKDSLIVNKNQYHHLDEIHVTDLLNDKFIVTFLDAENEYMYDSFSYYRVYNQDGESLSSQEFAYDESYRNNIVQVLPLDDKYFVMTAVKAKTDTSVSDHNYKFIAKIFEFSEKSSPTPTPTPDNDVSPSIHFDITPALLLTGLLLLLIFSL